MKKQIAVAENSKKTKSQISKRFIRFFFLGFGVLVFAVLNLNAQVNCDLAYETTLQNFNVYIHNPSGATLYRAKMYIDADGSPRAYGPNNSGLDWTANAGYTGNWWGVVADASGQNPILQTATDPYPGMYVSTTSLVNSNYSIPNPLRYVNSETVPFIAMPTNVLSYGNIHVGDVAYVYNTTTGQSCFAIYADAGNTTSIGEASIKTASLVGVNPNVRTGGTSLGIIDYVVFPHSGFGQGYIPTIAQIDSIGNLFLNSVGGPCICSCLGPMYDATPPTTAITTPAAWDTANFISTFTDADNGCSGIEKSFYQVTDFNGTDWRANNTHGFFNDDFNGTAINPDWTSVAGTWNLNSNYLQETDENSSNTNLYAPLTQNLSDAYLYCWTGTIGGSSTNRRAGLHFFCDQPDSSNRGNSYFVYFRVDDHKIQIYKVVNNSWGSGPVKDTAYNFNANQAYDFKVMYNSISGVIRVYVNNVAAAQWVDASPISNGGYVSFRSANCWYHVDNFKVFRSRATTATITVGNGNGNDIRFQNPNPATPSGKISSIVTDPARNISTVATQNINVDFTNPAAPAVVNDGNANDMDTTYTGNQLQCNWTTSSDINSGIANYFYAIGTTPGASDIVNWTNNAMNISATATNLSLVDQQHYYTSVQAVDGANLKSPVVTSDGIIFLNVTTGISSTNENFDFVVYPNPSNGAFMIRNAASGNFVVQVFNSIGDIISTTPGTQHSAPGSQMSIDLTNQPDGIYFVKMSDGQHVCVKKVVKE